jgi:type I restriction enzyme R subunit
VLTKDDTIVEGESGQDLYQVEDYDRKIIVDERTELVAKAILDNINSLAAC